MNELKEAIIKTTEGSTASHPVQLFRDLLVFLYTAGFKDGQHYAEARESEESDDE